MSKESIPQPHDKLFRSAFSDPRTAGEFLRTQVRSDVAAGIDWSELKLIPGSYVDESFKGSTSDLLFEAPLRGRPALIYILFEHQSRADPWMALRLLRYMVNIWERRRQECGRSERLPVILPVVLAQSQEAGNMSTRFSSMLDLGNDSDAGLAGYVPDFEFRLIKLLNLGYQQMPGTPEGIMVLRALKAWMLRELLGEPVWDERLLEQVRRDIQQRLYMYIYSAPEVDRESFLRKIGALKSAAIRDNAMTLAQQFKQEGIQEGIQEGRLEEARRAVIEALRARFDSVPGQLIDAIRVMTDPERLHELLPRAVCCRDLVEFSRSV